MTTICIVQARFDSSRLPGKVLERIGDEPMLAHVLNRAGQSKLVDEVILATTESDSDDAVAQLASELGYAVVRGSTFDVLDRFHDVLKERPLADVVVRVTADCPFLDPELISEVIQSRADTKSDYASNRLPPPFSRTFPVGLDVEVCTAESLQAAWEEASEEFLREHVTPFLYLNEDRFKVHVVDCELDLSAMRWTVDTPEDLAAARRIASHLPADSNAWRDVLAVMREHPEIQVINAGQSQKVLEQVDDRWSR